MLVQVWELGRAHGGRYMLKLKGQLHGHSAGVSCVCVSKPHGVAASGDIEGKVVIWDLVKLRPIRQLPQLGAQVQHISVHAKSGQILCGYKASKATQGGFLAVWTINGVLIAATPTLENGTEVPGITSLAYSFGPEWDEDNVYITGHDDGTIRFWSIRMEANKTLDYGGTKSRTMQLRTTLTVSTSAISALLVDEALQQSIWIGDMSGKIWHASVAAATPVAFNVLAVGNATE